MEMRKGPSSGGSRRSSAVCGMLWPPWVSDTNWRPNSEAHWGLCSGVAMVGRLACAVPMADGSEPPAIRLAPAAEWLAAMEPICAAPRSALLAKVLLRSEEHTSELQSLMRISYAVFCLTKNKRKQDKPHRHDV